MPLPLSFQASVISGEGRGKSKVGIPTINVNLADVPPELEEGIFACKVKLNDENTVYNGAMHNGPRPVFDNTRACEIHIFDTYIEKRPSQANIEVIKYVREIRNFPSLEELREQIEKDIDDCKAILSVQ